MAFFDNLKLDDLRERASDLANSGIAKSKNLAEIARLKAGIMAEEDGLRRAYIEIGKAVCESLETGAEAEIDAYVEKVKACKALIAENEAKIAAIRSEAQITEEEAAAVAAIEEPAE